MYCSTCGVAIQQTLTYCNHCGAKLTREEGLAKPPEIKPETLIQSIAAVFICGIGAITVLLGVLKAVVRLDMGQLLAFAMLAFLMMFLIEGVLIWLLVRGQQLGSSSRKAKRLKESTTNELEGAQPQALPEPLTSVTEHTTRAFDNVRVR